jgi:hypothetical protein
MEVRPVRHDQLSTFCKYGDKAYSSPVTHAIRCHDAKAHLQEHRDLVPPSHRDVGEAMDLPQVLALHSRKGLQSAYQEQCSLWRALGFTIKISFEMSKRDPKSKLICWHEGGKVAGTSSFKKGK